MARRGLFQFHDHFPIDSVNGLILNDTYLPEEVVVEILVLLPPQDVLRCALVCKRWCNLVKSDRLWQRIYNYRENMSVDMEGNVIPWYVYFCYFNTDFFTNMIKNGNGQDGLNHWNVLQNKADRVRIEHEPVGCPPLPQGVPEFNGNRSCFATHKTCIVSQKVDLSKCPLMLYIIKRHKPGIFLSEWFCWRYESSTKYKVHVCVSKVGHSPTEPVEPFTRPVVIHYLSFVRYKSRFTKPVWTKVTGCTNDYPTNALVLRFCHTAGSHRNSQEFFTGPKFAGAVLRFTLNTVHIDNSDGDRSPPSSYYW